MEILYISALSSKKRIDQIFFKTGKNPGFAVQKFSRLVVQGLYENGVDVSTLSNPPITKSSDNKRWINWSKDKADGIVYNYTPFINLPILKHVCVFIYAFFYVLFWGIKNRNNKAIICDVLSISICFGALLASKINRVRSVGVVTDIYSLMSGSTNRRLITKIAGIMQNWYSTSFTHYVLLTEAMNDLVNPTRKPYIVMEALCDKSSNDSYESSPKYEPITMLYAGGIEERYGLKTLVEAFCSIPRKDIQLLLYGQGRYVKELKNICEKDSRIVYKGVAPNEEIVEAELRATILVNPRFTTEEFTKYSFPSKNMEYMVSGTPLLTTNLPGMPKDYYPFVYLFDDESVSGYAKSITRVLSLSTEELKEKGTKARDFVLKNKNNKVQAQRILDILK